MIQEETAAILAEFAEIFQKDAQPAPPPAPNEYTSARLAKLMSVGRQTMSSWCREAAERGDLVRAKRKREIGGTMFVYIVPDGNDLTKEEIVAEFRRILDIPPTRESNQYSATEIGQAMGVKEWTAKKILVQGVEDGTVECARRWVPGRGRMDVYRIKKE